MNTMMILFYVFVGKCRGSAYNVAIKEDADKFTMFKLITNLLVLCKICFCRFPDLLVLPSELL